MFPIAILICSLFHPHCSRKDAEAAIKMPIMTKYPVNCYLSGYPQLQFDFTPNGKQLEPGAKVSLDCEFI